jgi:hypothetical protein
MFGCVKKNIKNWVNDLIKIFVHNLASQLETETMIKHIQGKRAQRKYAKCQLVREIPHPRYKKKETKKEL